MPADDIGGFIKNTVILLPLHALDFPLPAKVLLRFAHALIARYLLICPQAVKGTRMAKPRNKNAGSKRVLPEIDIEDLKDNDGPMEGPDTQRQIDRRHTPRMSYQTTAWLVPADETGAIRRPIIRTRDLNPRCMGFRTRQDVSALSEAILRLPATTGRCIAVACRVRRSLEMGNGWFDCLIEFLTPQPDLATRHAKLCEAPVRKTSHNKRRAK